MDIYVTWLNSKSIETIWFTVGDTTMYNVTKYHHFLVPCNSTKRYARHFFFLVSPSQVDEISIFSFNLVLQDYLKDNYPKNLFWKFLSRINCS